MRPETIQNLADIRSSAKEILHIAGQDAVQYLESRRDGLAIERLFKILGEALIRIREQDPAVLDMVNNAQQIIGFRNVLAHGYDQIDPHRGIVIISKRLPLLLQELDSLI